MCSIQDILDSKPLPGPNYSIQQLFSESVVTPSSLSAPVRGTEGINDVSEGKAVSIIATGAYNCHVALLDFYLSKIPIFQLGRGYGTWYQTDPLPHRTLQTLLKKMCQGAKSRETSPITVCVQQERPH